MNENKMVPVTDLFGGRPVMIYPREVPTHLGASELIALAAELVGREAKFDNVLQFLFVVDGGGSTKFLRIEDHCSSVTELAGNAREWTVFRDRDIMVN